MSSFPGGASGRSLPKADAVLHAKIMTVNQDSCLIAGEDDAGLYTVSQGAPVYGTEQEKTDAAALKPGQNIEIGYSGAVMESYPAQLGKPVYIRIINQGNDLVGFYHTVLQDLWEKDEGLNSDIDTLAFDLSRTSNLSDGEKAALIYLFSGSRSLAGISGTFDELAEQGYIDKDNLSFKSGLLITIEVKQEEEDSFTFDVTKWRSGTGAFGFQNYSAGKEGDTWHYIIGSEMIS